MIITATGSTEASLLSGGLQTTVKAGGSMSLQQQRTKADSQALVAIKGLASQRSAAGKQALHATAQFASQRRDAIRQAALEKLALLKAKLKSLMMFGGDPKTRAKMAADIAKEIGNAARA